MSKIKKGFSIVSASLIISLFIWLIHQMVERDKLFKELKAVKIDGRILKIEDKNKGSAKLTIKSHPSGDTVTYPFRNRYFFSENNITAGDSLSKELNIAVIYFYRRNFSGFEKPIKLNL